MRKTTLILFSFLFSIAAFSQIPNWTWGRNYDGFNSDTRSIMAADPDGNVYLAGNFRSSSISVGSYNFANDGADGTGELYIVKFDPSGTMLWARKDGGPGFDEISAVTLSHDNNLLVMGKFYQQITLGEISLNNSGNGTFIAKYDVDGNVLWAKQPSSNLINDYRITTDNIGNIYIAGTFEPASVAFGDVVLTNENYDPMSGNGVTFIVKMDSSGNVIWAKNSQRTGVTPFPNLSYDVSVDPDGNVFIGGAFFSETIAFDDIVLTKTATAFTNESFIAKYDINGNAMWAKASSSSSPNSQAWAVAADANGNSYLSGYHSGAVSFDDVVVSPGGSGSQMYLVKFDPQGNVVWGRNSAGANYSGTNSLDLDADGNIYAAGSYFGNSINFGQTSAGMANEGALFVTNYNPSGQSVWTRTASPYNVNHRISIDVLSQNEIYIAGYFTEPQVNFGSVSLVNTPATDDANMFVTKLFYQPLGVDNFNSANVTVSPNPFKDLLQIRCEEDAYYTLYDIAGKVLKQGQLKSEVSEIDTSNLQSGLYLLNLANGSGSITTKVVKE